jgi:uncharacterized protein (DUF736 family)
VTFELKDGQGTLWRNDRKEKPAHPDYRGDLRVEGIAFKLAGWVKETKDGRKYLSLSAMPKETTRPIAEAPAQRQTTRQELRDEIPWLK